MSRRNPSPDLPVKILEKEYPLEDWSQKAINEGQRLINGELTELSKTFANTLQVLKDALKRSSIGREIDLGAIEHDITAAIERSEKVAGYYPPGCYYTGPGGGQGTSGGGTGGGGGDT